MAAGLPDNWLVSRLIWRDAQGTEGSVDLDSREILIGRAMECAIRTEDAMVSRHHARVFPRRGEWVVADMGSSNGIFYLEERVPEHVFRHGDAVRCGSLWLRYVDNKRGKGAASSAARRRSVAPTSTPPVGYEPAKPLEAAPRPNSQMDTGDTGDNGRMRRRIEQLQAELRLYRGGGERALKVEDLENEVQRLAEERDQLKARIAELDSRMMLEGGDAVVQRAGAIAQTAAEIVSGLNDVLSNLRINVMAAEGEFEQYSAALPRASFELIREALRSSATDMESARELLRRLRALAM